MTGFNVLTARESLMKMLRKGTFKYAKRKVLKDDDHLYLDLLLLITLFWAYCSFLARYSTFFLAAKAAFFFSSSFFDCSFNI